MAKRELHRESASGPSPVPGSAASLPTRSEAIRQKKKKNDQIRKGAKKKKKRKRGFPLMKVLAAFFILLPLGVMYMIQLFENGVPAILPGSDSSGYETVKVNLHPENRSEDAVTEKKIHKSRSGNYIYHTVTKGETVSSLAEKYYHSAEGTAIIRKWNKLDGASLSEGRILKIPIK